MASTISRRSWRNSGTSTGRVRPSAPILIRQDTMNRYKLSFPVLSPRAGNPWAPENGKNNETTPDLFSRRFREGISFPNCVERSQNRALFEGEKKATRCREKGTKRGGQQRGTKEKRTRENRSDSFCIFGAIFRSFLPSSGGGERNSVVFTIFQGWKKDNL